MPPTAGEAAVAGTTTATGAEAGTATAAETGGETETETGTVAAAPTRPRLRPATIATAGDHACALLTGGEVACWGGGGRGQVEVGGEENRPKPVKVEGLSGAIAVTVSRSTSCALLSDGSIACWGELHRSVPSGSLWRSAVLGEVVQLVLADYGNTLCGLRADGTVACLPSAGERAKAVVVIPGIDDAISLSYGGRKFCALGADKKLECWTTGGVEVGWTPELLQGDVVEAERSGEGHCYREESGARSCSSYKGYVAAVPVRGPLWNANTPAFAWSEAVDYAGQGRFGLDCIRDRAGVVKCWGTNEHGELGNGRTAYSAEPRAFFDTVDDAIGLSLGGTLTCVRRASGGISCVDHRWEWETPEVGGVRSLAVGYGHSCAIVGGGQLRCWGDNSDFQLGVVGDRDGLVAVPGVSNIVHIAVGGAHTCAARLGGELLCWGSGDYGELGDGRHAGMPEYENSDGFVTSRAPLRVSGVPGEINGLALGEDFSCAATQLGLYCWGMIADAAGGDDPGFATPEEVWDGELTKIRASGNSLCGLDTEGVVRCLGEVAIPHVGEVDPRLEPEPELDELDEFGEDEHEHTYEPDDDFSVANPFAEGGPMWQIAGVPSGVTDLAVGSDHACALAGGSVYCWGDNDVGQLGDGSSRKRGGVIKVAKLNDVVEIEAGDDHTCARRKDGTIACWGSWTAPKEDIMTKTPTPVVGLKPYLMPGMLEAVAAIPEEVTPTSTPKPTPKPTAVKGE